MIVWIHTIRVYRAEESRRSNRSNQKGGYLGPGGYPKGFFVIQVSRDNHINASNNRRRSQRFSCLPVIIQQTNPVPHPTSTTPTALY